MPESVLELPDYITEYKIMKNLRATLVGRNKETVPLIKKLVEGIDWLDVNYHIASNGHADLLKGVEKLPNILIVDLSAIWREELEAINTLNKILPAKRPHVIVLGSENNTAIMSASMKIGARGYFHHPFKATEFLDSLNNIAEEYEQLEKSGSAKIITVLNGKGGSGATMLASNLSHMLAEKYKKHVALFDFHNSITSLPLYFDIRIKHTLGEAISNITSLDEIALQGLMEEYSKNLQILSSKHDVIAEGVQFSGSVATRLIKLAEKTYEYIVIDLPASMDSLTSKVLHSSDQIFLITQQSIPHVNETSLIYKEMLKRYGVTKDKVSVVINRYRANDEIRIDDVKDVLGDNIVTIPSDYKIVNDSLNVGSPLYEHSKKAKVTQAITEMSKIIVTPEKDRKRSKWSRPLAGIFHN